MHIDDVAPAASAAISLADLTYDDLRRLARDPNLTENEKMGFGEESRSGYEPAIFRDILTKLPVLKARGRTVVDIGSGCGRLARLLIDHCIRQSHRLILVDSPEMLGLLPDQPAVAKVPGRYPGNSELIKEAVQGNADVVLCYSVFMQVVIDSNPFNMFDSLINLIAAGGSALIGDIPNVSKLRRFFASEAGRQFQRRFKSALNAPGATAKSSAFGRIDDALLAALVRRAQDAGCNAYLLPQPANLRFANRRDDLLIQKP